MRYDRKKEESLLEMSEILKNRGIKFALGGSGLVAFYGCKTEVHDWDLTTDAPMALVEDTLTGLEYTKIGPNGIFASEYLFKINFKGTPIDLIGKFALRTSEGIFDVPTIVSDFWGEIPIGCPHRWAKAYKHMGRLKKAELLQNQIKERAVSSS